MRVILQRVKRGSVTIDGNVTGSVEHGFVALVGVTHGDTRAEAELLARRLQIPKVVVAITNDNLPSLYFYQRRGYYVTDWVANAVAKLSRSSSLVGFAGIRIRDEIRLEKKIA